MKTLLSIFVIVIFSITANAQNTSRSSGLAVSLGASAVYYYGRGDQNFDKFQDERLNWQLNAMLGLTIARDKAGHRTMIAGFGVFGLNNSSTMKQLFKDQGYTTLATDQSAANNFYQLEGGLLIGEILRVSTGVGQQVFREQVLTSPSGTINTKATSLKYYSSTVGFNFNLSSVALLVNCNFNYGQDYEKTIINPSAGLVLRF